MDRAKSTEQRLDDGTRIIRKADGTIVMLAPDGRVVIEKPDGARITHEPDGRTVTETAAGQRVERYAKLPRSQRPLNVASMTTEEIGRWMSNFAPTPFTLDGVRYSCVEAFPGPNTRGLGQPASRTPVENEERDFMESSKTIEKSMPGELNQAEVADSASARAGEARMIPLDNRILYYGRDREIFGFLSHFHPAEIRLDGETWPTAEHYYQAQKSDDPRYREAIRSAKGPGRVKRLAAQPTAPGKQKRQSWFRKNGALPRPDWHEVKLEIMRAADWAKFSQNPDLARLLLNTGDAELIEDSPSEPFWGTGPDGAGLNWAGKVLMEVRERLRGVDFNGW